MCVRGDGASEPSRDAGDLACPALFLAAWRADCRGNRDAAERLLLRCVATGRKEWLQWATAVTMLRRQPGIAETLGAEFELVGTDDALTAHVLAVAPDGAGQPGPGSRRRTGRAGGSADPTRRLERNRRARARRPRPLCHPAP
jgi:hypothetical protein